MGTNLDFGKLQASPFLRDVRVSEDELRLYHTLDGKLQSVTDQKRAEIVQTLLQRRNLPEALQLAENPELQQWISEMCREEFFVSDTFDPASDIQRRRKDLLEKHSCSKPRELYLFLNNGCNQDCKYCYVHSSIREGTHQSMDLETMRLSIGEFFKTAGANGESYLELRILGGEPMLDMDLFAQTMQYAMEQADLYGIRFSVIVNSNATLIDENATKLLRRYKDFLVVVVSLDGQQEEHDKFRRFRDDTGTYTAVMQGIELLKESDIETYFHTVISSENAEHYLELLRQLKAKGVDAASFSFLYAPDFLMESMGIYELPPKQKVAYIKKIHQLATELDIDITGHWKFAIGHLMHGAPFMCRGATHSLCVTSEGNVYPCQRLVGDDSQRLSRVAPGFIQHINFDENATYQRWIKSSSLFQEGCLSCDFTGMHGGGCPHSAKPTKLIAIKGIQSQGAQQRDDCSFNLSLLNYWIRLPLDEIRFTEFDHIINGMIYDNE